METMAISEPDREKYRDKFMKSMMRAILVSEFGNSSVLRVAQIAKPTVGPRQILVQVLSAGVNPVDTYIRSGVYGQLPTLPFVPGKDGAGVVTSAGSDIEKFRVGDRVYTVLNPQGTYAEFALFDEKNTFKLPDNVPFSKGACIGVPGFTAYRALFRKARAKSGETVFVHGATGGVGMMVVQMAKAAGLQVIGTAGTSEGSQAIVNAGATAAFNHRSPTYVQEIQAAYPAGFDICIEMLASTNLNVDLGIMTQGGRVVIVGSRGSVEVNPRLLMVKELEVYGVALATSTAEDYEEAAAFIDAGLRAGSIDPPVGLELPLEQAPLSHEEVIARATVPLGNIVLNLSDESPVPKGDV